MPQFETPWVLGFWILVPILLGLYIWFSRMRSKRGMRFTNTGVLGAVVPKQSQWVRHVAVGLSLISLTFLVGAFARPQGIERVPRERATIVLVMDVSQSMQAIDVKPNRLDAAKESAVEFVQSLPSGYNVAVVALSGDPQIVAAPTTDRGAVERVLQALTLKDSTAVGDAITVALKALDMAPKGDDGTQAPGAIVLLSDGQNTTGTDPLTAAEAAKQREVPIVTIAYGTANGYVDIDGAREAVPPDTEMLKQVAAATGGEAYSADSLGSLKDVYKQARSEVGYEDQKKETTATWAFYGFIAAALAAVGAVLLGARKL
ncbi:VWA domain-containing protein [Propionicicella superfundia]|uniref:VWA domain-containing protein n=1 Tax=Propionicicella superfundia TaxID=348582 RepID=UPI0004107761|nr:VWA domain-containing protein [Propionicicella superfundia]